MNDVEPNPGDPDCEHDWGFPSHLNCTDRHVYTWFCRTCRAMKKEIVMRDGTFPDTEGGQIAKETKALVESWGVSGDFSREAIAHRVGMTIEGTVPGPDSGMYRYWMEKSKSDGE